MTALLCLLLAAAPNEDAGTRAPSDWSKVPRVFVATADAKLHEKPNNKSSLVADVHFGAPAKVLQRAGRWYRVACDGKAGYLCEDALTSARFEDDFDADGDLELATVALTAEGTVRVRFYEPKDKRETFI